MKKGLVEANQKEIVDMHPHDLLVLTEGGPRVGHGLDREVLEQVLPTPDRIDQEMKDSRDQIGHITTILKGDCTEVHMNGGGPAPEVTADLGTAQTPKMTSGSPGLEAAIRADPPHILARKEIQKRPLIRNPTETQNLTQNLLLIRQNQTKEHNTQEQRGLLELAALKVVKGTLQRPKLVIKSPVPIQNQRYIVKPQIRIAVQDLKKRSKKTVGVLTLTTSTKQKLEFKARTGLLGRLLKNLIIQRQNQIVLLEQMDT